MAANPVVVIDHGKVEIPKELRNDPRFSDGACLQLVPMRSGAYDDDAKAWEDFMSLGGLLAKSSYDPNAELEKEKQRELEQEARWARG